MKIGNRLSLDQRADSDVVVRDGEPPHLNYKPSVFKLQRYGAMPLVYIDDDSHVGTVAARRMTTCAETIADQSLLALSQSKSA